MVRFGFFIDAGNEYIELMLWLVLSFHIIGQKIRGLCLSKLLPILQIHYTDPPQDYNVSLVWQFYVISAHFSLRYF